MLYIICASSSYHHISRNVFFSSENCEASLRNRIGVGFMNRIGVGFMNDCVICYVKQKIIDAIPNNDIIVHF
jgi:hypothetical protein